MEKLHLIHRILVPALVWGMSGCLSSGQLPVPSDVSEAKETSMKTIEETKEYIGMWVTADGYIRHELLVENRYDEARGNRKSAYQGSYEISGNHIDYKDDTGFTADGVLYHAGMILYKEKK
jgi:hypothetical protein